MVEGKSTNTRNSTLSFRIAVLNHHEPQSSKTKLLLPIMPIDIVAYALALLWENPCRSSCILFCAHFAATVTLRARSRALEENNSLQPRCQGLLGPRPQARKKAPGTRLNSLQKITVCNEFNSKFYRKKRSLV